MELLGDTTLVAFDKTGTLSRGTPEVVAVRALDGTDPDRLLGWAAAAERYSEHPLAAAVLRAAREHGLDPAEPQDFLARPGRGVWAKVDGRIVEVGSPAALSGAESAVAELERQGFTAVLVHVDGVASGVLGIADRVRDDAAAAVGALAELTGARPVLLTGDNSSAATRFGDLVGISEVRAGLLPQDKVAAVRDWQSAGRRVAVVGDGLNDAPALAAGHCGIAMGGAGADLALEAADAVIVRDDLTAIASIVALSRRARRVAAANLAVAATFIAGLVVWDLVGHLPLPLGVAGHEGSTVVVGLNGLRLLRGASWPGYMRV
jgi:P-type E1-E2 ATPase